jgi:pimeloyl-ACP methyl ester carboxylesterase
VDQSQSQRELEIDLPKHERSRIQKVFFRLLKVAGICFGIFIACGVILWNWPTGFYTVATALGRLSSGVRLEEILVRGIATPTLDGGSSVSPDPLQPDRTPILFLHGWGTSKEAMMSEMRWFVSTRRVIAPDMPGFGANMLQADQPAFDGAGYVKWIEDFRMAANLGRVDVVGESMGGALAAAYAAAYPDSVRRVVLQSAAGLEAPRVNAFMRDVAAGKNPLLIASSSDFDRVINLCFAKPPPIPTPFKTFLIDRSISNLHRQKEMVNTLQSFLLNGNAEILGSIRAPTLILYGTADQITDASLLNVYREGIRNSTGVLIEGAGHVIFYDAPKETFRAISSFLDSEQL